MHPAARYWWTLERNRISETIQKSMDTNIPSKMTSSKPSLPWINNTRKRNIRKKRKLYDKARKTGSFKLWDKLRKSRRKNDRYMRKPHREHVKNIRDSLKSDNTKPSWNYVKFLRRNVFDISPLSSAGRIISSPKEKAEVLNEYFLFCLHKSSPFSRRDKFDQNPIFFDFWFFTYIVLMYRYLQLPITLGSQKC